MKMRASELITLLQAAVAKHGDLPLSTESGMVERGRVTALVDGDLIDTASPPNELMLELEVLW